MVWNNPISTHVRADGMTKHGSPQGRPQWALSLGDRLQANVPLAPFTTLKIGGPADWYYPADTVDQLVAVYQATRDSGIPIVLLGDGSNVLVSDRGVRGIVIHNRACKIERRSQTLLAESGALLADLVERSRVEGLGGLEFAAGIYGSVGGAIFGNAGAYGRSMQNVLTAVEVMTPAGDRTRLGPDEMEFSYRHSGCAAHGWVVLSGEITLAEGDRDQIGAEIGRILAIRATKLPVDLPSAGSYFKNIEDPKAEHGKIAAGKLLEAVGAKGLMVGGAAVYEGHANVIINRGDATAADVLALAQQMTGRVRERFDVLLEPEVRFLGEPMG